MIWFYILYFLIALVIMGFLFLMINQEVTYRKRRNYITAFIASLLFPILFLVLIGVVLIKRKELKNED